VHPTLDLENQKGKVNEWLDNEPVRTAVRKQFRKFLRTFKDDNGERLYMRVMENMVLGEWLSCGSIVIVERGAWCMQCMQQCLSCSCAVPAQQQQ
jgi:hypothetical protein